MQNWQPFRQQLLDNRHRAMVVITGDWYWCLEQLNHRLEDNALWLGDNCLPNTTPLKSKQALQWLGQECEQLIINAHNSQDSTNGQNALDLNALGALAGTLKAGGICFILCPSFEQWQSHLPNRLTNHLINTIKADNNLVLIEQTTSDLVNCLTKPVNIKRQLIHHYEHCVYKTEQQKCAVEKIKKVAQGHRRRPLVLTADRGRGKSSALGLALAELLLEGKQKIIISAPQVASVHAVFARATEQLNVLKQTATELITEQGTLVFIPPDELIRLKPVADLVMIDEAAAIPAPMLTQLLEHYARIVFTSTICGYEGTGRGFEIRFKQTLNQLTPNWKAFSMDQPIRWASNDPLEHFINQALMLNAQAATVDNNSNKSELVFTHWNRDKLLTDTHSLSQIIGLLTLSHYKTTPNDFKYLLDGLNVELFTLSLDGAIVATALIAKEGQLSADLCQQIWQGKRRPQGHLLPQTLSCHAGFIDAPKYSYARVIRIAVHPNLQCKRLGSSLLKQLTTWVKQQKIDFVGSSFGATCQLLQFWQNNGFTCVRLGLTKEATSNEYSAVVLKSLNGDAAQYCSNIAFKFNHELSHQLIEFYPLLPASLVIQLLAQQTLEDLQPLSEQALSDLKCYVEHKREYEFASLTLYQFTLIAIAKGHVNPLNELQQQLLVDKILRKKPWGEICQSLGYSGKKKATAAMKEVFVTLVLL